jgi:drug/metabolite transporter (DMT)-like permease
LSNLPWGETAALITALSWCFSSLGFGIAGRRVGALAVNQVRIVFAAVALLALYWCASGEPWPTMQGRQALLLAASGVVGLAVGDSFYFHCIAVVGPRIGSLLMATAPVQTAALAWLALGERLDATTTLGIGVTLSGVGLVLSRGGGDGSWRQHPEGRAWAIAAGLLGALGQAGGLVMSKLALAAPGGEVSPLGGTLARIVFAVPAVLAINAAASRLGGTSRVLRDPRALWATLLGTAFGPVLGVWMSLEAVKHTSAGVAATLMATTPVLMLPVARLAYGARPSPLGMLGTVVAVAGAALLSLRQHAA